MSPVQGPAPTPLVLFGKTPQMADFVRLGVAGPLGATLEHWIEQGLAGVEGRGGPDWPAAYANGAMYAFVFRPPRAAASREGLVGVIRPSFDAVGRRYPLALYVPAFAFGDLRSPHVLPMALGDFFEAVASSLARSAVAASASDLATVFGALSPPTLERVEPNAREYDAWAAQASLADVWRVVFGEPSVDSALRAMHVIADALGPFRGDAPPSTKLGLRLPLGGGGVAAAAFWLDVIRRLARAPSIVRTCFWSFDGRTGVVLVQIGDTPASTLGDLWSRGAPSDHLCDLVAPTRAEFGRLASELPSHIAESIRAPGTLVSDFLDRLTT